MRGQSIHTMPGTSVGAPRYLIGDLLFWRCPRFMCVWWGGDVPNQITAREAERGNNRRFLFTISEPVHLKQPQISRSISVLQLSTPPTPPFFFLNTSLECIWLVQWRSDTKAGLRSDSSTIRSSCELEALIQTSKKSYNG